MSNNPPMEPPTAAPTTVPTDREDRGTALVPVDARTGLDVDTVDEVFCDNETPSLDRDVGFECEEVPDLEIEPTSVWAEFEDVVAESGRVEPVV
ncbi:hypothetical protein ONZ51_g2269 [Trametes cubensis]|uniref:Uncharacterized protein n=1 Tax=Trametes cubensis TaxID=1111947 RepID=A0AAD7TZV8_9APHY|nr:hypothetical protein ONZ51_g2269 [Trametes cubensis]